MNRQGSTLVIAPHPDDEIVGMGGILAGFCKRQIPVHILYVTTGIGRGEGEAMFSSAAQEKKTRRSEALETLCRLGATGTFLDLPSRTVLTNWRYVLDEIRDIGSRFDCWFAPNTDKGHPDHDLVSMLCKRAVLESDKRCFWYALYTWRDEDIVPAYTKYEEPNILVDRVLSLEELNQKKRLLEVYKSEYKKILCRLLLRREILLGEPHDVACKVLGWTKWFPRYPNMKHERLMKELAA